MHKVHYPVNTVISLIIRYVTRHSVILDEKQMRPIVAEELARTYPRWNLIKWNYRFRKAQPPLGLQPGKVLPNEIGHIFRSCPTFLLAPVAKRQRLQVRIMVDYAILQERPVYIFKALNEVTRWYGSL